MFNWSKRIRAVHLTWIPNLAPDQGLHTSYTIYIYCETSMWITISLAIIGYTYYIKIHNRVTILE